VVRLNVTKENDMSKTYTKQELHAMTNKQLQTWLTKSGVEFEGDANKATLVQKVWDKQNADRLNGQGEVDGGENQEGVATGQGVVDTSNESAKSTGGSKNEDGSVRVNGQSENTAPEATTNDGKEKVTGEDPEANEGKPDPQSPATNPAPNESTVDMTADKDKPQGINPKGGYDVDNSPTAGKTGVQLKETDKPSSYGDIKSIVDQLVREAVKGLEGRVRDLERDNKNLMTAHNQKNSQFGSVDSLGSIDDLNAKHLNT